MNKVFLFSPELDQGGYPEGCPFNSRRPGMLKAKLELMGLLSSDGVRLTASQAASREELLSFHTPRYLELLEAAGQGEHTLEALEAGIGSRDCPVFPGMLDYLALAAGGSLQGARLIRDREAGIVFNPAGGFHHAAPGRASGFCFLNDVVLAAGELAAAGLRPAVVDLDAHHSDGVQNAFYERSDILVVSFHESGKTLFPGTGAATEIGKGQGRGYTVNLPLPVATYDEAFYNAFRRVILPVLADYQPGVLVLEMGLDGLAGDPLVHLNLTNNVFVEILLDLIDLEIPLLMTGGGGYHIQHTVRGWSLLWQAACDGRAFESLSAGMGGVMLENADWAGGLRDRRLVPPAAQQADVNFAIEEEIRTLQELLGGVFPRLAG